MAARKKDTSAIMPNLRAVFGSDDVRVKEAAIEWTRRLMPVGGGEFGLEVIDGTADNSDHASRICGRVLEALQTLPFFGLGKVVWLKNANFLADTVTGAAAATLEALDSLMKTLESGLPPDVSFVLSSGDVDKRRTFFLRLERIAGIEFFDLPDPGQRGWEAQVEATVTERAGSLGLRFEPDALALFVTLAGERTQQVIAELEKIDLFLGPQQRVVTTATVREIVPLTRTGVIFEVGNAIGQRDARRALELIDRLLDQGESPIGILLAAIIPKVRNLLMGRELAERWGLPVGPGDYRRFQSMLEQLPAGETAHLRRRKDGGPQRLSALSRRPGERSVHSRRIARRTARVPEGQSPHGEHRA